MEKYKYNIDKMFTYLRAFCVGARLIQSVIALNFARDAHAGQTRKDGVPYIVHPLSMACYAIALGIKDDNIISTILLHDVAEDCGIGIDDLPVNDIVKTGCKYMTVTKFDNDKSKIETKRRYFNELLESREAIITKGFDRYNNLTDMAFALSDEAIGKNCAETEVLLLPVLKKAKEKWIDLSDIFFILRTNIRSVNDILKLYNEEQYIIYKEKYEKE